MPLPGLGTVAQETGCPDDKFVLAGSDVSRALDRPSVTVRGASGVELDAEAFDIWTTEH